MNAPAMPAKNLTRRLAPGADTRCDTHETVWEQVSGCADLVGNLRRPVLHAFRPALAHQQKPDAFQQIDGSVHPFGEENVRLRVVIVDANLARDKNGGCMRREILD